MPNADSHSQAEALLAVAQALVCELRPGKPPPPIALDSVLDRDLGLDSLGRVELVSRIERHFGCALPERLFAEAETLRDLLRALAQANPSAATAGTLEATPIIIGNAEAVVAPHTVKTLVEMLQWHTARQPNRPHIRFYSDDDAGTSLTYRQLYDQACQLAVGLQAAGVRPGQAVAIMLPTSADYFFSFAGILLAGAVPVPMYPPPRIAQLEEHLRRYVSILSNCAAPVLITVAEGKRHAKLLCSLVGSLSQVVSVEDLAVAGGRYDSPPIHANDLAFLQYTSGSTGNPKGVMLTHANLLANVRAMGEAVAAGPDDVFVSWLPLYHDMGLIGAWLGSLYHAAPLVVMPPLSFIAKPQRWLQAIHRYRGSLSAAPNFGYETCVRRLEDKDIAGLDLSSWRAAFNGAEAVVPETVERFVERFAPFGFRPEAMMPVYGLAESSVGLGFPPLNRGLLIDRIQRNAFSRFGQAIPADAQDHNALRFVACGLPLPGHQFRVVDEAGRELPERRQGRIEFRGPSATSGYFHDSAHTRALFHGDWLDAGDLGYIVNGELYVTGRIKDLIIRAGRNIYPQEVEQAVSDIDGVRKTCVAVFGGIDAGSGTERLIVLAETRRLEPAQAEALRAKIHGVVTDLLGEPPDDIVLAPPGAVLKTSSGKVRRSAIRELYERGELGKTRHPGWRVLAELGLGRLRVWPARAWLKTREWLFAGYAWGIFGLLAPVVWLAAVALPGLASRWEAVRGCISLLRKATRIPFAIQGLENLPPPGQPFVLVANHSSYLDAYLLVAALPYPVRFVAKVELGRDWLLRLALQGIGTEFVERFDAEKSVDDAKRLAERLRQGQPLAFFPEGTFSRRPGLLPFHLGAFAVAAEAGVPVLPVALRGTRSMLREGTWFPRFGVLSLSVGKPIFPLPQSSETPRDPWQETLRLRDLAREHLLRQVGEPDLGQD